MYNEQTENSKAIIYMDEVVATETHWLWYPYIPYGKITIIQGDPGEGKSTLALNLIAAVSKGLRFPTKTMEFAARMSVYQNAEDGLNDTIKPRLEKAGAACEMVAVLNEAEYPLSMTDPRLEVLLQHTQAKLLVLDPMQAYLGDHVDMHRANEIRPVMHALASLAERYDCAIVLIGHMNKMSSLKSIYRGLGSIDIIAAARSVLTVARDPEHPENRVILQVKNSLAAMGEPVAFTLDADGKFKFLGAYEVNTASLLANEPKCPPKSRDKAEALILACLEREQPLYVRHIYDIADSEGINKRTLLRAKTRLGIAHEKTDRGWIWVKPAQGDNMTR